MKTLIAGLLILVAPCAMAQKTFKTEFSNSESSTIEIAISLDNITIVGGTGNEIIIESIGENKSKNVLPPVPDVPKIDENKEMPDRAKGLKQINPSGKDNSGVGVYIEKQNNFARLSQSPNLLSDHYKITIPNKVKLNINDMHPYAGMSKFNYLISNLENEITVTSINSNFKIENIKGPLVLNATNGSAEVKYSEVKTSKPISIVTVNGYVDLTLPASLKADMQLQSMNGEAYTDFDIKEESSAPDMNLPGMNMFIMEGKINGGGSLKINIHSINGDIYLRKKSQ